MDKYKSNPKNVKKYSRISAIMHMLKHNQHIVQKLRWFLSVHLAIGK